MRRNFIPGCPREPILLAILLCWGATAGAQGPGVERIYAHSQDAVEKAVAQIRPTAKGRIPVLEGFVGSTDQPLERYTSGFYECSIKVSSESSGGTLVRVTAKITAWYTDQNPARSGYRALPSNGRLETDLLDRLSEALDPGSSQGSTGPPPPSEPAPSSLIRPPDAPLSAHPVSGAGTPLGLPAPAGGARLEGPGAAAAAGSAASGPALEREQTEKHADELRGLAQNLEEILRNQAHPDNLAAVRKSGTPVHTKPQSNAPVLFSAEAQDEFQILEVQPLWVHVQISGASRGWIRREQVELPEGFAESPGKTKEGGTTPGVTFRVTHESVTAFAGNWPPLRGKTVKAISVEPTAGEASSAREKRAFAKSLLEAEYTKIAAGAESMAGVVIVFDAADGGQIAATMVDIQRLKDGRVSEAAFWQQCSLDPPEAFQDTAKPQ